MLITLILSVVAKISRTTSSLLLFSQGAGVQELAGSTARQPAQPGQWKYSIPLASCSDYEWGLAGGQEAIGFLVLQEFKFSLLQSRNSFRSFTKFAESTISEFHDRRKSVIGW